MKQGIILLVALVIGLGGFLAYHSQSSSTSPKDAIREGVSAYREKNELDPAEENLLRIQLAVADYMANHKQPPDSLADLVPMYFDRLPVNPRTNKPFQYSRNGSEYTLESLATKAASSATSGKDSEKVEQKEDFLNPNTMQIEDFVYDPTGKRNPYVPFTAKPETVVDESLPPLLRYDLGQLRVAAILSDSQGGRFAMVEDAAGTGYPVKVGDAIGNRNGQVIGIEPKEVIVLETFKNLLGEEKTERRVIELVGGGAAAGNIAASKGKKRRNRR